jgi:hypothetical protein
MKIIQAQMALPINKYKPIFDKAHKKLLPSISIETAESSYFIHPDGQIYNVASCLTHIFVEAVKTVIPYTFRQSGVKAMLEDPHLDLTARWYILIKLVEAGCPLKLYTSREQVERAVSNLSA